MPLTRHTTALWIRPAVLSDFEVAKVIQERTIPVDHPYHYAENIRCTGTANFVAESNKQVVGYVSVLVNHPTPDGTHLWERMRPYIGFVGVLPECQLGGVGRQLILHAVRQAIVNYPSEFAYLESEEGANGFYEKVGFQRMAAEEVEQAFGKSPRSSVWRIHRSELDQS